MNEALNVPHVLGRLPESIFEVILVDAGSIDGTVAVARAQRTDMRVVRSGRRTRGSALACGFAASKGDIIVVLEADGSSDPAQIPAFVAALRSGADFATGRCGYYAFWRHCLEALDLRPGADDKCAGMDGGDGFAIETVINTRVARAGLTVVEVTGWNRPRISGLSNVNAAGNRLRVLRGILHDRPRRPRTVTSRRHTRVGPSTGAALR